MITDPAAKKEDFDLRTFVFSWFLCPVFYGRVVYRVGIFGWYSVGILGIFTKLILEENSVGTFQYYFFWQEPLFSMKGGHSPLFEGPGPVVSCLDMYRTNVLMYHTMVLLVHPTKVRR